MLHAVFGEGLELCTAINPDEAVAEGAAIRYALSEVSHNSVCSRLRVSQVWIIGAMPTIKRGVA